MKAKITILFLLIVLNLFGQGNFFGSHTNPYIEFIGIGYNTTLSKKTPVGITNFGGSRYPTIYNHTITNTRKEMVMYDPMYKLLIASSGTIILTDCNDYFFNTSKYVDHPGTLEVTSINLIGDSWFVAEAGTNMYYGPLYPYASFTGITNDAFGGVKPHSGYVTGLRYNAVKDAYYYSTYNNEIGKIVTVGGNNATELLDISETVNTNRMKVGSGGTKVFGWAATTMRYAPVSTEIFVETSTDPSLLYASVQYDGTYMLGWEGQDGAAGHLYRIDTSPTTPTYTTITPSTYLVDDVIVDGTTVYLLVHTTAGAGSYRILVSTNITAATPIYSTYLTLTGILYRFFKY